MAIISKNERKLPDLYSVAPISVNQGCPQVQPLSPPDFLSHNVRKTGIDALKDREDLNKKISLREGQMRSIKQLRYWPKGMFLSQIIEQILPLLCEDKAYYFQKKNKTSGSFVINLPEKLIYVFPDGPFIKHQFSAYAETRTAIALPLDSTQRGFTVAYRMSQTCYHTNGNVDVIKTTTLAKRFLNELAVIRSFDCFLQTRCEFCFTQVERGFSFDKICVIQDGYASGASFSLYNVSDKNRALIVSQLAAGLALLHTWGC
jgi:hypothetical protein